MDATPAIDPDVMQAARTSRRRLDRVASVAGFNAWSYALLAGLSGLVSLLDPSHLWAVGVLAVFAGLEFRGRAALRRLEPAGPRRLATNQWLVLGATVSYCGWHAWTAQSPLAAEATGDSQVDAMLEDISAGLAPLVAGVYLTAGALSAVWLAALAQYYRRAGVRLRAYLRDTPAWLVDAQRR